MKRQRQGEEAIIPEVPLKRGPAPPIIQPPNEKEQRREMRRIAFDSKERFRTRGAQANAFTTTYNGQPAFLKIYTDINMGTGEVNIAKKLKCNNSHLICQLDAFEIIEDGVKKVVLVYEYIKGAINGEEIKQHSVTLSDILTIFKGAVAGLRELHSHDIYHLDLKPANILIQMRNGFHTYVADYGLACSDKNSCKSLVGHLPLGNSQYVRFRGTINYIAPELYLGNAPTAKSDIYSLGSLFYSIYSHQEAFIYRQERGESAIEQITVIDRQTRDIVRPFPTNLWTPGNAFETLVHSNLQTLILHMLKSDPDKRPDLVSVEFILKILSEFLNAST